MPSLPEELANVRARPSMFLAPADLDTLGAYMAGFCAGRGEPEVMREHQRFPSKRLEGHKNLP